MLNYGFLFKTESLDSSAGILVFLTITEPSITVVDSPILALVLKEIAVKADTVRFSCILPIIFFPLSLFQLSQVALL